MNDIRTEFSRLWAGDIARGTDGIIGKAILLATGERWQVLDMNRVKSVRYQGDKFQTITLDGEPILELHDLEFVSAAVEGAFKQTALQRYRFLGKAKDAEAHSPPETLSSPKEQD